MSQAETDVAEEKLTVANPESTCITPAGETPVSIQMEATDSSKDDPSSAQDNPKADSKEVSQTSSTSGNEPSLLNIAPKDPEKDIKDESNKTTDSPKRVKLIRPEFDKEKLAQKIREIEEREKLKLLNKLKEEERAKSEEKSAADNTQNKTDDDKKQDTVTDDGKSKVSETLDNKNVVESDIEVKNVENSASKSLENEKSSKVDELFKEDSGPKQDITQDNVVSAIDSGRKLNERECKVSTSVEDLSLDSKKHEEVGKNIDSKPIPGTTARVPEREKQDSDIVEKDCIKTKVASELESEKTVESDDQVSSTVEEESIPSVIKNDTKLAEVSKSENVEQKVEQLIRDPEVQVESSVAKADVEETSKSQIQLTIKPANASVTENTASISKTLTENTASISKDVISSIDKQKSMGNIEEKVVKEQETNISRERLQNISVEKVSSKIIDSGKPVADSSIDNEKKKEDSIVIGSVKEKESDPVTVEKIGKTIVKDENIVKEQQSIKCVVKQKEESSVQNVSDEDGKSKIEKSREEVIESKTNVVVSKHKESKTEKSVSLTEEKGLKHEEKYSGKNEVGGKIETVASAPSISVQKSIESVLDELTVEPIKGIEKKIENLSGKVGLDTASKSQESLSAGSKPQFVDECSNKSEDILWEIEKFIDSSAEKEESIEILDSKYSDKKSDKSTVKTGEKNVEKSEAIQKSVVELSSTEKLQAASESKIVSSSLGSESSAPTAAKRKLDDDVANDGAKKKYSTGIIDPAISLECSDIDDNLGSQVDVLKLEKNELSDATESKKMTESELDTINKENKRETSISVPVDSKDSDDKSSSKELGDDDYNDDDGKTVASKEAPPLESILDSIIDFEPAEIPEEDLVISDVPSTALVESKIPESPRRVKLVRPSKPATKTLTKPEITKKISQTKAVEQKVESETKVEKDVSLKPSIEKPTSVKPQEIQEIDTKNTDKEETKTSNIPQPSDKTIELEKKLSDLNEPNEKIDLPKVLESPIEVNIPTEKASTSNVHSVDEKLTIKKETPVEALIAGESSSIQPQQKLQKKQEVETPESDKKPPELVEKTLPDEPSKEEICNKELSKDINSEKLPLEQLVSQPKEKITDKEPEPSVDTAFSISLEEFSLLKNTEPIQSIVPEKVVEPSVKPDNETVEKSSSEKPLATPKLTPSEETAQETVVTKESTVKLPEVSKISEISTPEKNDVLKSPPEKNDVLKSPPEKNDVLKSPPEKSPVTPVESETAKLRRIIRKPRHERLRANESKQAEAVTSSTVIQSAHDVESKQVKSASPKQQASESLVSTQGNVLLDMTVDEDDDNSKEGTVTSSETKQEVETPETKQLGIKLKIAKPSTTIIPKEDSNVSQPLTVAPILAEKLMSQKPTEHTFGSITISTTSSSREKHQTDMKKVEEMLKDTDVTITPLVDRDSMQKLSKITLKIGKDGNPPEIKQPGESWNRQLDADIVAVKRKPGEQVEEGSSPSRKKIKDESAVLTTSAGVEIDLHMKKPKLLSSLISEPPMTSQDPRLMMTSQQMMGQTPQQTMGLTQQTKGLTAQQMMSQLTPQQTNIFLGTPQSAGMFQGSPVTPGTEVVKKKRGRPRKIPLPEGQKPQDQQLMALKQQMMMQSQQGSSGTGTSSGSGSDEYSSGVFPQVPLFDMTESLFDQSHLFPNQVKPMRGRPQRSCRGRIKLPSVRSRKPRGSTLAARASTGRGRGRGYKRVFTENDNIITLENVKEEMRRQSLEQAQFMGSNEPMEVAPSPQMPQEPVTSAPATSADPVQGAMKSPERKPRKRKNEEEERERIEKIKQKREEKKMKTLEKKRKIAEAKANEKAAVMAAALVEEETRMSAPERKEEEKKKDVKTEEKKVEGETDVSLVEEPSQPDSIRVEEPEEVSEQSLETETKEPIQFAKELIEAQAQAQESSTTDPVDLKPDLDDLTTASGDEPVKIEPSSFQDIKKESSTNTDIVEPSFVTPRKEKKVYRCLICREDSPLKKLTSPLDHRSWRVLYQAAIVRGHEEIINLTKNLSDEIPTGILYHRNCRSEFTHKKTLAKLTDCPITEDNQPIAAKTPGAENINPNTPNEVRMDGSITEYQWPLQGGELYMIQEQVSDFLEITSFKRKYPDIARRTVEPEEKAYLRDNGLVSEAHCDLGLIAVKSSDVLDIMFADFQDKYEEFRKQIRDKQARELSSKHKAAFTSLLMDKRRFENRVLDAKTEAMQAVASWNSRLNRTRVEQRRCMLDLQSMIVHYPKTVGIKRSIVPNPPGKVGNYPIALVPGQFCDNYKRYNPNELKYFPLNTVIYGPMKPNERRGGGSDGSQTDSDDSSSSDDSSDTSSESSDDSDASCDDSNDKDMKDRQPSGETHCKVCGGDKTRNKQDNPEVLINCAQCTKSMHPTCISLTVVMVPHIRRYDWQCTDCKTCIECKDPADEEKMLFCDLCDRGYHIYCVGLRKVPNGRWHCQVCSVCNSCGTTDPGGSDWQHEYKKEKNVKVYLQTLCGACDRQWRKGYYCQICLRCYVKKPEEEQNLIKCTACDRWMHSDCCRSAGGGLIMGNSVLCELCQERAMPKNIHKNRERVGSY